MALPTNPQPDDVAYDQGIWQYFANGNWETFGQPAQNYLNRAFTDVSGTGDSQVFTQRGTAEPPMPRDRMFEGMTAALQGSTQNTASPNQSSDPNQMSGRTLQYHWNRFMPGVQWPPKTGPLGQIDTQLINSFLQSMRVQGVPGFTEATTFTLQDAQGRTRKYGQPPGSNTLIELGIEGEAGTGTPQAVDIGGQQYFQQPGADGQFERIPQAEGAGAAPSIQTIGGIQFINQGGQLVPIDNVMKNMKENMVVTGDFEGAAAVHQWETRPSNQEYFDRMLQYVNAPADQLLISAIARGQGLVAPPPEETIQRIGPPPEYLTEAFNMLRDQMQMGQPGEGQTAQSIMQQRFQEREDQAAQLQLQSQEIANRTAESQLRSQQVKDQDEHNAAITNNEAANIANRINAVTGEMDLNDRIEAKFNGSVAPTPYGAFDTGDDDFLDAPGTVSIGSLPLAQRPQMSEYNDVAAEFANTGFQFGEVRGISREDMDAFINSLSPEQRKLAENQFKDQGGLAHAGAFFDSVAGLEKALNFHLDARDMALVDLNKDGQSETGQEDIDDEGQPIVAPSGEIINTDNPAAVVQPEAPIAGVEAGETDVDEIQRAGTTGAGMTRDEIFQKYPFLAPEGWKRSGPMSEEEMDVYGSTIGPTEAEMDVYGSTIPEPRTWPARPHYATGAGDIEKLKEVGSGIKNVFGAISGLPTGIDIAKDIYAKTPGAQRRAEEAQRQRIAEAAEEVEEYYVAPRPDPVFEVDMATPAQAPTMAERIETFESQSPYSQPSAFVQAPAPVVTPVGVGAPVPEDPDDYAGRWYDEGAYGVRTGSKPTLVGESGPELALFPNGTEIVPLDRPMRPSQARRLRRRGIRGMQEGGLVFGPDQYLARGGSAGVSGLPGYKGSDKFVTSDTLSRLRSGSLRQDPQDLTRIYDPNAPVPTPKLPRETASSVYDSPLPLGIRQLQAGRSLGAPRGQLLRTAGIALPSAQARRRMLPSEREAFEGLGRMAGIPAGEFQQELGITTPSGAPRTGSARMLPLSLRR